MNIQNIEGLAALLKAAGFGEITEARLLQHCCLQQASVTISERIRKGADILVCSVFLERREDGNYSCLYYDAALRKSIPVTPGTINGISVADLDKRMQDTDWQLSFAADMTAAFSMEHKERWIRIDTLMADLSLLSETDRNIADSLKFKYWMDTPFQSLIANIAILKGRYETGQRFYFFDNGESISVEEAYRFLNNRKMEKLLQEQKKQVVQKSGPDDKGNVTGTLKSAPKKTAVNKKRPSGTS